MTSDIRRKIRLNVVLDTNILLSAFFFGGKPREIWSLVLKEEIQAVSSLILLGEFYEILNKKFLPYAGINFLLAKLLKEHLKIVQPKKEIKVCRDRSDNCVLEAAIEGKCKYIITGDKDLLTLKKYKNVQILTAAEFLILWCRFAGN